MAKKTEIKTEKIEREYVIPLRKQVKKVPRYKKANKAIRTIKEFLVKHMKIYDRDLKKIKLDTYLNEFVWFRGIKNPPHKIKVKAMKEGEIVRVELVDVPGKLKFKKLREEKRNKIAKEIVEKKKSMMQKAKEGMKSPQSSKQSKDSSIEEKQTVEKKVVQGTKSPTPTQDKLALEEKEKKAAVVEAGKELEKEKAKEIKKTNKPKSPKQEKNTRTGYNKSSRGH